MIIKDGITYMHEHVTINLSRIKNNDDTNLNCFDETVLEYKKLYSKGVRNIVDVTNMGMERNPLYVQRVADETGINIVQATGFYTEKFLPEIVKLASPSLLAQFMVHELHVGIVEDTFLELDGPTTSIKAQIIGEIASSKDGWTENEKKVFDASIQAHKKTDAPITTHTTLGTFGREQVALFKQENVNLSRILIGHVDLSGDIDYILSLLDQGVYVGFDTIGKENYLLDSIRVNMLQEIEKRGFIDQVVLSMDITRKSNMQYNGGIGYSYLLDCFVPMMQESGISESFITKMLQFNPQRFMNKE